MELFTFIWGDFEVIWLKKLFSPQVLATALFWYFCINIYFDRVFQPDASNCSWPHRKTSSFTWVWCTIQNVDDLSSMSGTLPESGTANKRDTVSAVSYAVSCLFSKTSSCFFVIMCCSHLLSCPGQSSKKSTAYRFELISYTLSSFSTWALLLETTYLTVCISNALTAQILWNILVIFIDPKVLNYC